MAKATKRQMLEREEDIQESLREGKSIGTFGPELATKHRCSAGSIERQYRAIINYMKARQEEARDELKVQLMLRNDRLYEMALHSGNVKHAMDVNNLQAKIGGLYQPDKLAEGDKEKPPSFMFEERDNSVPLTVVPEDDDDRDASNS